MDATCAPSNIRYPQDISPLNEGREKLEGLIGELHGQAKNGKKPLTYRKNAHKDYLRVARKKRKTAKKLHKGIGKQLRYMERDFVHIKTLQKRGRVLNEKQEERPCIRKSSNATVDGRGNGRSACWRIKCTETVRIMPSARNIILDFPGRRPADRRSNRRTTKKRNTGITAIVLKQSALSAMRNTNSGWVSFGPG